MDKGNFQSLQQNALHWSNRLKQAFAVCNSLNMVSKTAVAGVDMERSLFKLVEARFLVGLFFQRCRVCLQRLKLTSLLIHPSAVLDKDKHFFLTLCRSLYSICGVQ